MALKPFNWVSSSSCPHFPFEVTCVLFVTVHISAVYFSTVPIAERFFTSSTSLTLKHAAWYPCETLEPHIVLLTSDNTIR